MLDWPQQHMPSKNCMSGKEVLFENNKSPKSGRNGFAFRNTLRLSEKIGSKYFKQGTVLKKKKTTSFDSK